MTIQAQVGPTKAPNLQALIVPKPGPLLQRKCGCGRPERIGGECEEGAANGYRKYGAS